MSNRGTKRLGSEVHDRIDIRQTESELLSISQEQVCISETVNSSSFHGSVGLRNAKSKGLRLGRPRTYLNPDKLSELRALGLSWRQIAKKLGVGVGTVHRAAQRRPKNDCGSSGTQDLTESEGVGLIELQVQP